MAGEQILIVDDNAANLKVARFAMEAEGYQVRTAADAESAQDLLRTYRPQLILMDIQLPGMDGLALTRLLKADPATRAIIVVAVSAYAMKGDQEKALDAGCAGYITKPIDPLLLPAQIGAFFGHAPEGGAAQPAPPPLDAPRSPPPPESSPGLSSVIDMSGPDPIATILVVEDNPTTRRMYRAALELSRFEVVEAADGEEALAALARRAPDLIVQDLVLPDTDGFDLTRRIRERLGDLQVPIVCVSGFLSRLAEARAPDSGYAEVLAKPVDPFHLLEVVHAHVAKSRGLAGPIGQGRRVLVVDDDPLYRRLAQAWFESAGFHVETARDGVEAMELALRNRPDAIVADVLMPAMDGFELCLAVRRHERVGDTPVILMSSAYVEHHDQALAERLGASSLVLKTAGFEAVARAVCVALDGDPPGAPSTSAEVVERELGRRARAQLKRQVVRNAELLKRSTLQAAQLAVLARVADALATDAPADDVLADILSACLDMAGVSKGALYVLEGEGPIALKQQLGFSPTEVARLEAAHDNRDLFADVAHRGRVIAIPSNALAKDVVQRVTADAGVTSLLLVPVTWGTTAYGTMLLGAQSTDLASEEGLAFARVLGTQLGQALVLARGFARVRASELRYRTLTEHASDVICILSPTGVLREVNRRYTELLGYPANEVVGKHIRDFVAPDQWPRITGLFEDFVSSSGARTPPIEVRRRDEGTVLLEFSGCAVDVGGETLVLAIGRDVTEQVKIQQQLMVSDRMASIGTLAAGVAHEINNPLAVVLGNLELAVQSAAKLPEDRGPTPVVNELREALRDAHAAADRVREIVKDLRIFARQEAERRGPVDTKLVLESTLRMAWNEVRHRARLVKSYGVVPMVDASDSRLGQVFLNLVVNAAQAIPEGHADTNEIRVSTRVDAKGRVEIEIRDTGPGIPPETLARLFTPFFTTKPAGVGTGLGLAICQRIVTGFGGEIKVESQVGVGTAFKVFLPAARGTTPAAPIVPTTAAAAPRRGNILVVDDDPLVGTMVSRVLSREHDVVVRASATEALASLVGGARFDVILCDLMMPVMTGMEFHGALDQAVPEQARRIVFLTGGAFTPLAREFLDRVPNARMEKPFDLQALRATVNERVR